MKTKIFGGLLIAALAVTSVANAQTYKMAPLDSRQTQLERRITAGADKGLITHNEALRLHQEATNWHEQKRVANLDGTITPAERRRLSMSQDQLSADIDKAMHNRKVR